MSVKLNLASEQKTADNNFWNGSPSNPYSDNNIIDITDEAADVEIPVTSIPSPFAQMHLIETAFEFINNTKSFEGKSVYNRLVSYCLDVFELLFNSDELEISTNISSVSWSVDELKALAKNTNVGEGLAMFIKTLDLYIRNYNVISRYRREDNPFSRLTILSFNGQVFAGTSPFTGFFTTGNPINIQMRTLDYRQFFGNPVPLFKREQEFIKFMNLFLMSDQKVISSFKELHDYVKNCREFTPELRDFFTQVDNENISEKLLQYPEYKFGNNPLYILPGIPFRKKGINEIPPPESSDYRIRSRKILVQIPLALPLGTRNTSLKYLKTTLPEDLEIPVEVSEDYQNRILPGTPNLKYPYIVRNDFLSKYLVELNYPINHSKFFTGYSDKFKKGYLIPIKSDYFKYFTIDDLKENLEIGVLSSGAVCVKLHIPIMGEQSNGRILFERTYNELKNPSNISSEDNGAILPLNIYMGFYPFFKVEGNEGNLYNDFYKTFIYFDSNIQVDGLFLKNNIENESFDIVNHNKVTRTRKEEDLNFVSDYYEISKTLDEKKKDITYDIISLTIKPFLDKPIIIDAVLIPEFEIVRMSNEETYLSFDIGTTNTFISYAISRDNPQQINTEYKSDQDLYGQQLVLLHNPVESSEFEGSDKYDFNSRTGLRLLPFQMNEFMPSMIGRDSKYRYPMNTVIYYDNDVELENTASVKVLSNINIPFAYGIWRSRGVDRISTNLKWDVSDVSNQRANIKLKSFIKESVLISRNKILLEGRNPKNTIVIWFKPLSMGTGISNSFGTIWLDLYNTYFAKKKQIAAPKLKMMSESTAPFYELASDNLGEYFLNIDVGGGTSDIVVYHRKSITLSNSFRFAGNAIFGNGLDPRRHGKANGIAKKYYEILKKVLEKSNKEKAHILDRINKSDDLRSEDMINFFFSIPDFKERIKSDQDLKILFLLHNAALFYHSAQIMKSKGLGLPKFIGFSGNGSKLFEITNGSPNLNAKNSGLLELVNRIFKFVYQLDSLPDPIITFKISENPKESTAYGGIKGITQEYDDDNVHVVFLGNSSTIYNYRDAKRQTYSDIMKDDKIIGSVMDNYINFIQFFFDTLWFDCDFKESFAVNSAFVPKKIKEFLINEKDVKDYIYNGLDCRIQDNDTELSETLFFYPLIASLYYLSQKLICDEINEFK